MRSTPVLGTITALAGNVSIETGHIGTVGIKITGTFSATLTFEATMDGTNWDTVPAYTVASSPAIATGATSTGIWQCSTAGYAQFRVNCPSSFTSGTATVTLTPAMRALKGSAASSLLSSLGAYWKLDESGTGTRADVLGTSDLTNNNGVVQATGPAGTVFPYGSGFLIASSRTLSVATNSKLEQSSSFTLAFWLNASVAATMGVITKDDVGTNREWGVYYASGTLNFYIYDSGGAQRNVAKGSASGTHFFICSFDNSAKTVSISMDGGAASSASTTNVIRAARSAPVTLGAFGNATNYLTGTITAMGIWQRLLTSDEQTRLYASGAGLQYPWN